MTGMKEGAGENPFADDAEPTKTDSAVDKQASTDAPKETAEPPADTTDKTSKTADSRSSTRNTSREQIQIPYKFRRDSVQDGRDRVPLFLQPDTKTAEREALRELEERFGDNVSLTDLREALVKVGLDHLDETEENLEEWGYGMTFD
jgi:hypothetical protein